MNKRYLVKFGKEERKELAQLVTKDKIAAKSRLESQKASAAVGARTLDFATGRRTDRRTTDRFRAAVMGAGISHWLSFHGMSCLSDWDAIHYTASPYDLDGPFQRFSPLSYYENLNTPTLILHGEKDEDVPVEQSHLFYRALKNKGVPAELVVYPREPHAVTERAHVLDMSRRVIAWLGQWLDVALPNPAAADEDSRSN